MTTAPTPDLDQRWTLTDRGRAALDALDTLVDVETDEPADPWAVEAGVSA
jgi:hypothetical protein